MAHHSIPEVPHLDERTAIAAQRKAAGTVVIYHSCDPPGTKLLHSYKRGKYTPRTGFDADYPTEYVYIPRRHGTREAVLRCAKGIECLECSLTEYESSDLTLAVAKAHGIRGAYIRPTSTAKSVQDRLRDGEERGRWMSPDATPEELECQVRKTPQFHELAGTKSFSRVLNWLREIPWKTELMFPMPLFARNTEATMSTDKALRVQGMGRGDTLGIRAQAFHPNIEVPLRPHPVRQAVSRAQEMAVPVSYVANSGRQLHSTGAVPSIPKATYMLPQNIGFGVTQLQHSAAPPAQSPRAAHVQYITQNISRGQFGPGTEWADAMVKPEPDQMLRLYHLPASGPVAAPASNPMSTHFGVHLPQQQANYGAPFAPAAQRPTEKRLLEESGALAQARRKRMKYDLADMFHGI